MIVVYLLIGVVASQMWDKPLPPPTGLRVSVQKVEVKKEVKSICKVEYCDP